MAINLVKGQTIDLRKNDKGDVFDLSTVTIGLGWDVKQKETGFFGKLFGAAKEEEYDLDAVAFLLNANGKVSTTGDQKMVGGDIIFYNSLRHPSGHIWLTGDNRTGAGEGDDEQIVVKLDSLNSKYDKIIFIVAIYQGRQKGQHFGLVENAFIRAVDARGKEIAKYSLSGASYNGMCSMTFAEIYRKDNSWKFRAIGEPDGSDAFLDVLRRYL